MLSKRILVKHFSLSRLSIWNQSVTWTEKANDSKVQTRNNFVDEEIDAATIVYNEVAALVDATHKDIQVLIEIYEPCIEREAENEVSDSDDTIETLSVSEVDAESGVFGGAAETP